MEVKGIHSENRQKLLELIRSSGKFDEKGIILLKGPVKQSIYDDDIEYDLSPENMFLYLFGVA